MDRDPPSEDLARLFLRLAGRDPAALGEIWLRFQGRLLAFARYRVRSHPELCPRTMKRMR